MILVKIWKFPLCLFLRKIGPKVIFDDHVVRKQAILDYKNIGLHSYQIGLKGGVTLDLG